MTELEYRDMVQKAFYRRAGKTEEAQKYFVSDEAQEVIKRHYKSFSSTDKNVQERIGGSCDPEPTASCLYMMMD